MRELLNTVEKFWCESMHTRVMWPIHGHYRCSTCLREYAVAFASDAETQRRGNATLSDLYAAVKVGH